VDPFFTLILVVWVLNYKEMNIRGSVRSNLVESHFHAHPRQIFPFKPQHHQPLPGMSYKLLVLSGPKISAQSRQPDRALSVNAEPSKLIDISCTEYSH
jgi:hypothetical protein